MTKKILVSSIVASFLLLSAGLNVFAVQATSTKLNKTENLACAQTAVSKREATIQSAFSAFGSSIGSALQVRGSELATAWGISDRTQRVAAIKNAWNKFKTSKKSATETFRKAKQLAWQQFRTDLKACKVQTAGETEGSDISF